MPSYFIVVDCRVTPRDPWTRKLIDEFGNVGFIGFEENDDGFKAYIAPNDFEGGAESYLKALQPERYSLEWTVSEVRSQDWNKEFEQSFHPVNIDGKIVIRGPFHKAPPDGVMDILIQPRLSFGTGHHPSTQTMMRAMLRMSFRGRKVLDLGCGTGILAILAGRLGARSVAAIDIDIRSVYNTAENLAFNKANKVTVTRGDMYDQKGKIYNVLLVNIDLSTLTASLKTYAEALTPGGTLVAGGFLETDLWEVYRCARTTGFDLDHLEAKQSWVAGVFTKTKGL